MSYGSVEYLGPGVLPFERLGILDRIMDAQFRASWNPSSIVIILHRGAQEGRPLNRVPFMSRDVSLLESRWKKTVSTQRNRFFSFRSNWKEYDRTEKLHFYYKPNGIPFGSVWYYFPFKLKVIWSYWQNFFWLWTNNEIQFER